MEEGLVHTIFSEIEISTRNLQNFIDVRIVLSKVSNLLRDIFFDIDVNYVVSPIHEFYTLLQIYTTIKSLVESFTRKTRVRYYLLRLMLYHNDMNRDGISTYDYDIHYSDEPMARFVPILQFSDCMSEDSEGELGYAAEMDTYKKQFIDMCISNKLKNEKQLFGYQSTFKIQISEHGSTGYSRVRVQHNRRNFDSLLYLGLLHYISVCGIFLQGRPVDDLTFNLIACGVCDSIQNLNNNRILSVLQGRDEYDGERNVVSFKLYGDDDRFSRIYKLRSMSGCFFGIMHYILSTDKQLTWVLDANLNDYKNFKSQHGNKIGLEGWREIYDELRNENLCIRSNRQPR